MLVMISVIEWVLFSAVDTEKENRNFYLNFLSGIIPVTGIIENKN